MNVHLDDAEYRRLLGFRDGLRRFLRWSEEQARAAGLTPAQHQLLLAVRGHEGRPTIGDLADHLLLRHHSVVELVDRAERAGLVRRRPDRDDHRIVHVGLTAVGSRRLAALSAAHLEELQRLSPHVAPIWAGLA
jgi:DNA-binding MarR family transcriptional regulator